MTRSLSPVLLIWAFGSLVACGGGGGASNASNTTQPQGPPPAPPPPVAADIVVSPDDVLLTSIGETQVFSAQLMDADGIEISNDPVAWSSSSTSVAIVDEMTGIARAVGNGTTTITASADGISESVSLTVRQEVASVSTSPTFADLDRWGDTLSLTAEALDDGGTPVVGASIAWSSSDPDVAAVDQTGQARSWAAGDALITAEASLSGQLLGVSETISVRVHVQQNAACEVPIESPVQGAVASPAYWDVRRVSTQFRPEGAVGQVQLATPIALDVDRDGDPDLLSMISTPENQGVGVPILTGTRIWLNDGGGYFSDGTADTLGQNDIPWGYPSNMAYADFDTDGFEDVVVFSTGWERSIECGAPGEPDGCTGGPNLLFSPQPGGLRDSAPIRLSPYDTDGFTHSGTAGDVDCDGDIDIVEMQWPNQFAPGRHHLQINSGAGTFVANDASLPQTLFPEVSVSSSALCDLDRDGDLDLVTSIPGPFIPQHTRISVNDGFGRFRMLDPNAFPAVDDSADEADCADLDLDGYADVVLSLEPRARIFRNLGNMSFADVTADALPPDTTGPITRNGLGIVDLNGDGWLDITPARDGSVYWNIGGGTFTRGPPTLGIGGTFITVADFDSDGRPDIYHNLSLEEEIPNTLYLNRPDAPPAKLVFATSSRYTANLGGLAGADAKCQQHASAAGLPGSYVAYLSDSNTHALNRLSRGEFHRTGDNALVAASKLDLSFILLQNAVANDEYGSRIVANPEVVTGTDHFANKRLGEGVGFCSDWTRDTNEAPGLVASGFVDADAEWWVWAEDRSCSVPQRLYCFQQ